MFLICFSYDFDDNKVYVWVINFSVFSKKYDFRNRFTRVWVKQHFHFLLICPYWYSTEVISNVNCISFLVCNDKEKGCVVRKLFNKKNTIR